MTVNSISVTSRKHPIREKMKNVLVIGSGGREHAFCWKLQQSRKVSTVYAFPGSEAIAQLEKAKVVGGLNLKDFQVGTDFLSVHVVYSKIIVYADHFPFS